MIGRVFEPIDIKRLETNGNLLTKDAISYKKIHPQIDAIKRNNGSLYSLFPNSMAPMLLQIIRIKNIKKKIQQ